MSLALHKRSKRVEWELAAKDQMLGILRMLTESFAFGECDQCASMPALDAVVLPVKFKSIPQEGHTQDAQRCGGIKISAWAPSCSTI